MPFFHSRVPRGLSWIIAWRLYGARGPGTDVGTGLALISAGCGRLLCEGGQRHVRVQLDFYGGGQLSTVL